MTVTYDSSLAYDSSNPYDGGIVAAFVQSTHRLAPADTTAVFHLPSNTTAGNTLIGSFCLPTQTEVVAISDTINGRWIQAAYASGSVTNCEMWYSRGIFSGNASVSVTYTGYAGASIGGNIAEFNGLWYVDPLDQWSQTFGMGASVQPQIVQPRGNGELVVAVGASSASVSGVVGSGYNALTIDGTGRAGAYSILSGSVVSNAYWKTSSGAGWCALEATFVTGQAGTNPLFQFPETLVEISTVPNYVAPLGGTGVWTNVSHYVESMTLGPIGRQHELDRVEAAAAQITMNNRDGSFNNWNSSSFLYNGGNGLQPMNPVKVTASWEGETYPVYYGYFQSATPTISDVLNVEMVIACIDIFQLFSLKYLSNDNYAQLVLGDFPVAYYRLGDAAGQSKVVDSSGNGYNGTLLSGPAGLPAFGANGAFLYDTDTALDCSNGTNLPNGGFTTYDYSVQPPNLNQPIGGDSNWSFECWMQWTATAIPTFSGSVMTMPNADLMSGISGLAIPISIQVGVAVLADNEAVPQPIIGVPQAIILSPGWCGRSWEPSTVFATDALICPFDTPDVLWRMNIGPGTSGLTSPDFGDSPIGTVLEDNEIQWIAQSNFLLNAVPLDANGNVITLFDGNFHHIVVTYDQSISSLEMYVDGSPSSKATAFGSITGGAGPRNIHIGIGQQIPADGVYTLEALYPGPLIDGFPGILDEVALYEIILTADQAANHYATGRWFQTVEVGAGSSTPPFRLDKVAAVCGLPSNVVNAPYDFLTTLYAETQSLTTTSALNYIQTQTETEPGIIFQGPDGLVYAFNREYQYINGTTTSSQGIFGDSLSAGYYYDGTGLQIVQDDLDLFNDVQVQSGRTALTITANGGQSFQTRTAGVLQEWGPSQSDAALASASVYAARTMQGLTSLQFESDLDALAVAQNYFAWYGVPLPRVQQIVVNSFGNGGVNIFQMLSRILMDQITVQYQGQTPGPVFSQNSLIESITHTIVMSGGPSWVTTWALSPYEILLSPFYLDSSILPSGSPTGFAGYAVPIYGGATYGTSGPNATPESITGDAVLTL